MGNVIGSNIANLLLIAGVAAALQPLASTPRMFWRDGLSMVGATIAFAAIAFTGAMPRWSGFALLTVFVAYIYWSYRQERRLPEDVSVKTRGVAELSRPSSRLWMAGLLLICGLAGVILGAELLILGGTGVARSVGVSEAVIALTLFALGTSLPELATVAVASWRGHDEVAMGNILGSCIFNVLAIAGGVVAIQPLTVAAELRQVDLWLLLAVTLLFPLFMATGRRLGRVEGGALLIMYGGYVALRVVVPALQSA